MMLGTIIDKLQAGLDRADELKHVEAGPVEGAGYVEAYGRLAARVELTIAELDALRAALESEGSPYA